MSGRKCTDVRISQNRYNNLLSNAKRADDARRAAERRVKKERADNRRRQRDFEHRRQAMQREYREGLGDLSANIQSLERQQNQRLEEVRHESARDLAALGRDVNRRIERFQQVLEDQGAKFQQALREHRSEMGGALQAIRDDIRTARASQRQAAQSQIDDLKKLFQLMRSQRAHERFAPGDLDLLEDRFSLCRSNFESGNFEAALANGQERYFEYQELQLRIVKSQAEWEAYLAEVRRLAEETSGMMAAAEGATYTFAEGDMSQTIEAEVDYWSEGALTDFRNRLDGHLERLHDPERLSTEELKQMLNEITPMEDELSSIVEQAKERLVQSQVRQNIAASILQSFEGTHWELDDSTYENEDFRRGFHLKLKNPTQEEIVASVTPVETADGGVTSNVEINFFDRFNDERLRQERLQGMYENMHTKDVQVGSFECLEHSEGRPGDEQMRDFEYLRQPQPASASSS